MSSHISFEIYKQLRTLVLKNINIISIPVYIKYFGTKFSMSAKDFFNLRKDIIQQLQLREKYGYTFYPNLHDKYYHSSLDTLKHILNIPNNVNVLNKTKTSVNFY